MMVLAFVAPAMADVALDKGARGRQGRCGEVGDDHPGDSARLGNEMPLCHPSAPDGDGKVIYLGSGFDSSEGFITGLLNGQQGWTVFSAGTEQPTVENLNFAGGDQHMRIAYDTAAGAGANIGGFSPLVSVGANMDALLSVDVFIGATGGANYYVQPQSPESGLSYCGGHL